MKLVFLRHGQTQWNKDARWQGQRDIALDETGLKQAETVAEKLKCYKFDKIYSSSLQRAFKTAEIVGKAVGVEVIAERDLQELDIGEWEGLTSSEVRQKFPDELEKWGALTYPAPGGESHVQLQERAYSAVNKIIQNNDCETVLIVTHGAFIRSLMCKYLNMALKDRMLLEAGNTGIFTVNYDKDKNQYSVITLNDHSHLQDF